MLSSDAATLATEPMFPFAASVLSGGSIVPGPVNGSGGGSSSGGSLGHLGDRRRPSEGERSGDRSIERPGERTARDGSGERRERERTASVARHPSATTAP